jgi:hypothetical protein
MKSLQSLQPVLASLLLAATTAACVADGASTEPTGTESVEAAELTTLQQERLRCNLEYARYSPSFGVHQAAAFDQPMTTVTQSGATASDGRYSFVARINPTPPYNLSFQVSIREVATGKNVAYSVLPPPTLGGAYLFEMGARIAPVSILTPTGYQQFDNLRSYCSLYLGS